MSKNIKQHPLEKQTHEILPTRAITDPAVTRAFAVDAARCLADAKCADIVVLDVQQLSQVSDFIVIASGTSDRQMRAAAQHVATIAEEQKFPMFRRHIDDRTTWIVIDCIDCVVHVFEPNTRAQYDLEMLWGDAPQVAWERPGEKRRHAADAE
jgi:ribosome-associated protein